MESVVLELLVAEVRAAIFARNMNVVIEDNLDAFQARLNRPETVQLIDKVCPLEETMALAWNDCRVASNNATGPVLVCYKYL